MNEHIFALFFERLSNVPERVTTLEITDQTLLHRIKRVLRLRVDDTLTFFDEHVHANGTIIKATDRALNISLDARTPNHALKPKLTVAIGLLKPDALHTAIYTLAELGANIIQLYTSTKVHRAWGGQKEHERLSRIAVAAAEQCKHFAMPIIKEPIPLAEIQSSQINIVCDPDGTPLINYLITQHPSAEKTITLVIGPEGDLTADEKKLLSAHYTACSLTPTVLRSEEAATLAAGIIRCMIHQK